MHHKHLFGVLIFNVTTPQEILISLVYCYRKRIEFNLENSY